MKRRMRTLIATGPLTLLLLLSLAACDSTSPSGEDTASDELAALESTLTQELGLSGTQQQTLATTMDRLADRHYAPGLLWELAAELQATLSDEQKQRLFERTDQRRRDDMCPPARFAQSGFAGRGIGLGSCLNDVLADEQKEAVEAIREGYRTQIEALIESKRSGDVSPEAFREAIQAIHEAVAAEIDALLTDEQRSAVEACRSERQAEREAEMEAFRAADRAAMSEVLMLTAEEEASIVALMDEHKAEVEALFEQFREGSLACDAFQETITALKEAFDEALQDVLDAMQWEIVQIHRALSQRAHPFGRRLGMGVFGGFGGFGLLDGPRR